MNSSSSGLSSPILITTSLQPSEEARSFCKLLKHVIPGSILIKRGSSNELLIHKHAIESKVTHILFVYSKGNHISRLIVKKVTTKGFETIPVSLKFIQYINPKIFNWKHLPASGPLSASLKTRQYHPDLLDFMEKYFLLEFSKKTPIWLMVDINNNRTFIQFIDALTKRKIIFAQIKLIIDK